MEWLNYHHLRYFWIVAKEGSLAGAAARLNVSAPSISEQIRELEEALGQKLFARKGRRNVLTEAGQVAVRYAEEIFGLGGELMSTFRQRPTTRALRLHVGVTDSFPKLVTHRVLKPAFGLAEPIHVICREGKMEDLLAQLSAHRLDLVLSDEPASNSANFKTFNHLLGETGSTFCAAPALARRLKPKFPKSLDGAPALLPAENTSLRRALEHWFRERAVRPLVIAEFDDLALMKVMAAEGRGFLALPTVIVAEAVERYGFEVIGQSRQCKLQLHAITAERKISHPAVLEIIRQAGSRPSRA